MEESPLLTFQIELTDDSFLKASESIQLPYDPGAVDPF